MQLPLHHGRSQGGTWAMVPKIYHFLNLPFILPILQKGHTTVEWTCWRHRNAINNMHITPKVFQQTLCLIQTIQFISYLVKKRSVLLSSFNWKGVRVENQIIWCDSNNVCISTDNDSNLISFRRTWIESFQRYFRHETGFVTCTAVAFVSLIVAN